jgi:membrane complex biogenesis BtpA family protein
MNKKKILNINKPVIGVIHVEALPGTPRYGGDVKVIIESAVKEGKIYKDTGVDSIIVENMHDMPYLKKSAGHEVSTMMSIIGYEVKNISGLPCGIQILAGANKQALAAANSAGLDFIRAEGFVFAHVADEGLIESDAGGLLRYRKQISAEDILVFTDIKKKHSSHSITNDVSISETAKAAEFFLSDGIIVTGRLTGEEANVDELHSVKAAVSLPIMIGSGITPDNIDKFYEVADGFIVGSYFKREGIWKNPVDPNRVKKLLNVIQHIT